MGFEPTVFCLTVYETVRFGLLRTSQCVWVLSSPYGSFLSQLSFARETGFEPMLQRNYPLGRGSFYQLNYSRARLEGFEPPRSVLETAMLAVKHHRRICCKGWIRTTTKRLATGH